MYNRMDLSKRRIDKMIATQNVSLRYGDRALFENVSIQFTEGNCYELLVPMGLVNLLF